MEVACALGMLLDEVIVEGLQVSVCSWCGERFLDDLGDLSWEIGDFADCKRLVR